MALFQVTKNRIGPLPRDPNPDHRQSAGIVCFSEDKHGKPTGKKNNKTKKTIPNQTQHPPPNHWKITRLLSLRYLYLVIFLKAHENHNCIEGKANVCILCE